MTKPATTPERPLAATDDRTLRRRSLAAAVVVTMLWSSSWILIRVGLDDAELPPLTFAALRYATAAAVLWAWVWRGASGAVRSSLTRRDLGAYAALGLIFYGVTQGAQFVAIDHQPAATTSLVLSLTPLVVAGIGVVALGERVTRRQLLGAALVVAGAALYLVGDLGASAIGMIAAGIGLAANAASSIGGRSVNRRSASSPVVVTTISMTCGAAALLVTGLLVEGVPEPSWAAVLVIGWLALVNTALAFTMWNFSLRHLTAVESSGINNLMLVQIAVLAWIFLGEAPGPLGLIGIAVVSIGVFFTQHRSS